VVVERVERSLVVRVPVEVVWRALTESGQLSAWFGGEVEVDPVPGGQLTVWGDGRLRRAVIVDLEPNRRLTFRWLPAHHRIGFVWLGDEEEPAGASGEVEITLAPVPAGTRVVVVEWAPVATRSRALART
jgi:uncharacterized protein YndB with AHSA1/START domain